MTEFEKIAYHEAGHAVVATQMHRHVSYVDITPTSEQDGICQMGRSATERVMNRRTWDWLEREIKILLAGEIAVVIASGKFPTATSMLGIPDVEAAAELGGYLTDNAETLRSCLAALGTEVRDMLISPDCWPAVTAVASALIEERRLGARRVRAIIKEALRPKPGMGLRTRS
jgi:hypothetical protein